MSPKRIQRQRKHSSPRQRPDRNRQHPLSTSHLEKGLIAHLYDLKGPASLNGMIKELTLSRSSKDDIVAIISSLLKKNQIVKTGKNCYLLNKNANLFEGILEKNPRGFGFATTLSSWMSVPAFQKDPFISIAQIGSANQGDRILIRIIKVRSDGHPEAEIIKILQRGRDRMAGTFVHEGTVPHVIPEDPRYSFSVILPEDQYGIAQHGDIVIFRIFPSQESASTVRGTIIEVLGSPENVDVQMRMVIEKFALPHIFSEKALKEANDLPEKMPPLSTRTDLRQIGHVTIDGETAKDFDDAVAVVKTRNGFRLYVSIADVSHFVKPGTALDKDAYERGTSIYFPGRVIPMLPEKLSNNLCSLVPDQDRLTFSAILDFDRQGKRKRKSFCRSIIRSRQRFTYTMVKKILVDNDQEMRRTFKDFLTPLKWAGELARELLRRRTERGAIGFNIPEPEISLDENGKISSIQRAERNFAHQIIEEFMLAANEAVAEFFTEKKEPALYRIHEIPSAEKVEEFREFAKTLGLELPRSADTPDWFGRVLDLVKDSPKEYVVNNLLLRTMQQARYSPDNVGHFGLAATDYTHFTSPIRRYPDLLVHRALDCLLNKSAEKQQNLKEVGQFLSARERIAISAEREINDRLKVHFMENRIGETFDAVISGVNNYAFFVELLDLFVNGGVPVAQLTDDYYLFDIKHHRLIGEIKSKVYQVGQLLRVTVQSVDKIRNRINFIPA
ncbi:MAG: ribonuclease R [Desulfocapsaceae bacterium]|nr:ribonuclease R [Desulfocapsaceae bacterium]